MAQLERMHQAYIWKSHCTQLDNSTSNIYRLWMLCSVVVISLARLWPTYIRYTDLIVTPDRWGKRNVHHCSWPEYLADTIEIVFLRELWISRVPLLLSTHGQPALPDLICVCGATGYSARAMYGSECPRGPRFDSDLWSFPDPTPSLSPTHFLSLSTIL